MTFINNDEWCAKSIMLYNQAKQLAGLGLVLCKEFTQLNGGVISVESEFGHGSKFILSFPIYNQSDN